MALRPLQTVPAEQAPLQGHPGHAGAGLAAPRREHLRWHAPREEWVGWTASDVRAAATGWWLGRWSSPRCGAVLRRGGVQQAAGEIDMGGGWNLTAWITAEETRRAPCPGWVYWFSVNRTLVAVR